MFAHKTIICMPGKIFLYRGQMIAVLLVISLSLSAQNRIISGVITDAENQQSVGSCSIILLNTSVGTTSNGAGKFKIEIPRRFLFGKLLISSLGYLPDTVLLKNAQNIYQILLKPQKQNLLNEVVVTGVSKATRIRENPLAMEAVSRKQIEQTVEDNVIDAIAKNAPGLQTVKTGPNVSKPFINGLGYNRVLTLYDGMRVETQQWGG